MHQVRHITCPLCEKGFAAFIDEQDYTLDGHSGRFAKVRCPKCDMEMFASGDELVVDAVVVKQDLVLRSPAPSPASAVE